jgi:hypothetical protein
MQQIENVLRKRVVAVATALGAIVVTAISVVAYAHWAKGTPHIVDVELGGSSAVIRGVVGDRPDRYIHALHVDFGFIAGYTIALLMGTALARALSFTRMARNMALIALLATPVAALCDVAEDLLLLRVLHHVNEHHDNLATAAQAFSFAKWVLVIPAAIVAFLGVVVTLWRAFGVPLLDRSKTRQFEAVAAAIAVDGGRQPVLRPHQDCPTDGADSRASWRANSTLPEDRQADQTAATTTGICVSGGGIRSATFSLGALDALRPVIGEARYIVSVSGGGYTSGALQLALDKPSIAKPDDVYLSGSSELDHTRRHGKYIADGAAQWLVALGTILRGLLVNLLTLTLVVVLFGRLLGHAYAGFPHDLLRRGTWPPPAGVSWTIGLLAAAWLLLWVFGVLIEPLAPKLRKGLRAASKGSAGLAALVGLTGVLLPLLAWAARTPPHDTTIVASQGTSLIAGYLATLAALGRKPSVRGKVLQKIAGARAAGKAPKNPMMTTLIVYLGLLAMVGALLLLLGEVLATTGPAPDRSSWPGHVTEWRITVAVAVVLAFFAVVDQVRWSLHPFYKRRIATAFSVRRVRVGARVTAAPYDFDHERTSLASALHNYGARVAGFPQVIFSCAAHVSGQEMTPPGRHVVPWTMSGDYIGSPVIGWVRTRELHDVVAPILQFDLTVQAAQAISGAAIASQMGRLDAAYSRLMTITNARLGSWLPNPAYLHELLADPAGKWWLPRFPRRRYLATFAREIVGSFPADGPLVYVTDGGHYENLGLVELLRHRCATIYCIDASGDKPEVATTIAQAVELAFEELGVVVNLTHADDLGSGGGVEHPAASTELIATLKDRLARSAIVVGTITYPDLGAGLPASEGRLVIGKAVLSRDTPFDVLAHATKNPTFPNDSTGDQWFDHSQFDAYHSLGRHVGAQVLAAMPVPTAASRARRRTRP